MGWLHYDEQFRQRRAVRPDIRWDHKDIGLWLLVTAPTRTVQPYRGRLRGQQRERLRQHQRRAYVSFSTKEIADPGLSANLSTNAPCAGAPMEPARVFRGGKQREGGDAAGKKSDSSAGGIDAGVPR